MGIEVLVFILCLQLCFVLRHGYVMVATLAGGLSLPCAQSMVDRWPLSG